MREQVPRIEISSGQSIGSEEKNDVIIDFQNVSFAYPSRLQQPVLNGLTLQVKRGQTVGLVGSSGCGKTTVLALLERFYDIRSGCLLVFGHELSSVKVSEYRKKLSLVSQEPTLYRGKCHPVRPSPASALLMQSQARSATTLCLGLWMAT